MIPYKFYRSYGSLEWALNSPPKPHAFVSLPLQSKTVLSSIPSVINQSLIEKSKLSLVVDESLLKQYASLIQEQADNKSNVVLETPSLPNGGRLIVSDTFIEMFRGFADGEGSFGLYILQITVI